MRLKFEIMKKVNSSGNLSGKVADLGAGTGRLAIAAALLGADVTGYEIDPEAMAIGEKYSSQILIENSTFLSFLTKVSDFKTNCTQKKVANSYHRSIRFNPVLKVLNKIMDKHIKQHLIINVKAVLR